MLTRFTRLNWIILYVVHLKKLSVCRFISVNILRLLNAVNFPFGDHWIADIVSVNEFL